MREASEKIIQKRNLHIALSPAFPSFKKVWCTFFLYIFQTRKELERESLERRCFQMPGFVFRNERIFLPGKVGKMGKMVFCKVLAPYLI